MGSDHLVIFGEYGHAIGGPRMTPAVEAMAAANPGWTNEEWRKKPEAQATLGPVGIRSRGHPNVFPNMWITEARQVSMRLPKGPDKTEIWWFTFVDKNLPKETLDMMVMRANHTFGPAGMLEQDDGENWDQSTRGTVGKVTQRYPLNYSMNLGRGDVQSVEGWSPFVETHINEHAQLWTYRAWADWMAAESWADLRANHTLLPEGSI